MTNRSKRCIILPLSKNNTREWRNWQTRTFEGRVVHTVRVQVPFLAPSRAAVWLLCLYKNKFVLMNSGYVRKQFRHTVKRELNSGYGRKQFHHTVKRELNSGYERKQFHHTASCLYIKYITRVCAETIPPHPLITFAGMAELADALDSGSSRGSSVKVQVLLPAPWRVFL